MQLPALAIWMILLAGPIGALIGCGLAVTMIAVTTR